MLLLFLLQSCHFTTGYINDEADQADGKRFLEKFYLNIKSHNYTGVDHLASDTLEKVVGNDALNEMCKRINDKVGDYESYSITKFFIDRENGKSPVTKYAYRLRVKYKKSSIDEILHLRKQGSDSIKLDSYKVYSDLLIH